MSVGPNERRFRPTKEDGAAASEGSRRTRGSLSDWFAVEEVEPRTWLVGEPGHVNCFLVEGAERAVLVDTGLGLADVRAEAEALTGAPILAVNTHGHDDHRGGNWRFAEVAAHPLAAPAVMAPVPPHRLAAYLAVAREQFAAYERARVDDERFFHLFTETTTPRPLPPDADGWTVPAGPPPQPLADRQRIDLGGRVLTVLHTPGHSPDSLSLLDERAGLLFAGDTLITGDFWAHTPDTEIGVFARTLRALSRDLAGSLRAIYPAHTLRYRVGPDFLRRAADAFEAVAGGTSTGRLGADLLGRPALRHEFADFTVLRPAA
ncbi:MAG: MBL fold metallo-hydrolase [Frankia sp.]